MIDLKKCQDVCDTDPQLLSIGDVRTCIDMVDEGLAHLIDYRLKLTEKVGEIKALNEPELGLVLRPHREAELLRKWIHHFDGKLVPLAVQNFWRTLISTGCLSEQEIRLLIPNDNGAQLEALDYFGRFFPHHTYESLDEGIRQASKESGQILILDPTDLNNGALDQLCEAADVYGLKGFLKLPFIQTEPSTTVLCFGFLPLQATGNDMSLLACRAKEGNLPDTLADECEAQDAKILWQSASQCLIERPSFLDLDEPLEPQQLFPNSYLQLEIKALGAYPVGVGA